MFECSSPNKLISMPFPGTMIPFMPAAMIDSLSAGASPNASVCSGGSPSRSAARRKMSGAGFDFFPSSFSSSSVTITSNFLNQPCSAVFRSYASRTQLVAIAIAILLLARCSMSSCAPSSGCTLVQCLLSRGARHSIQCWMFSSVSSMPARLNRIFTDSSRGLPYMLGRTFMSSSYVTLCGCTYSNITLSNMTSVSRSVPSRSKIAPRVSFFITVFLY